jgi:hypothetical protein
MAFVIIGLNPIIHEILMASDQEGFCRVIDISPLLSPLQKWESKGQHTELQKTPMILPKNYLWFKIREEYGEQSNNG